MVTHAQTIRNTRTMVKHAQTIRNKRKMVKHAQTIRNTRKMEKHAQTIRRQKGHTRSTNSSAKWSNPLKQFVAKAFLK